MENNNIAQEKHARGGTGSKGDPVEIKRAIAEATKDLKRTGRDMEKITKDKEELLHDLAALRIYEKEETSKGFTGAVKKTVGRSISAIQKKLQEINGMLPEVDISSDQKKIHRIITEWKEGKKILGNATRSHARAEHKLATHPADQRAMGDANRAEAARYDITERLNKLAGEALLIASNKEPDTVADETVNIHTGEEAAERETGTERTEHLASPLPPQPVPAQDEGISYTHEQAVADQREWDKKHTTSTENIIVSALQEISREHAPREPENEKKIDTTAPSEKEFVKEAPEEAGLAEITQELPAPEPHLLLEEHTDHPSEEILRETKELPEINVSEAPIIAHDEPLAESPTEETVVPQTARTAPEQHALPPYVDQTLKDHLNKLFGIKGFLGFGSREGMLSPHWADETVGFATKTVEEIRTPRLYRAHPPEVALWGMENEQEKNKMRDYLLQAIDQTGVSPTPGEKMVDYITRALTVTANKNG